MTFLLGLTYALEEAKAEGEDVDGSVITNIKTSLMGPLAGIGDSIFRVTLRVIGTGIEIGDSNFKRKNFTIRFKMLFIFSVLAVYT